MADLRVVDEQGTHLLPELTTEGNEACQEDDVADHVEDELVMEVYLSTAETIASSGDQTRALKALIR